MPHGCPRPRMRWNGAIGAIARGKKVSTVCAPKSRARHALRLIGGETPGARGVATLFTPYMRPGQDESNPVSLLQCLSYRPFCPCGGRWVSLGYLSAGCRYIYGPARAVKGLSNGPTRFGTDAAIYPAS